ncbi:putative DNA-binding transcriptional regulator [compost metagenome]
MLEELNAYKNNKKTVNIYSLSYVKNFILPGFIGDFKKNFKNYKINLSSIETPFNEESLNSSSFDIIISSEKFLREDIVCQKLFDDEFVALASPKFNIKDEYSIEEILTLPIIIVNNNTNISKYVEDKLSSFSSNSDSLNVLFTTDSPLTALNALLVNEAISFAPKTVAQLYTKDHNLKEVKISNFALSYSMYLLVNRSFYMDEKVFIDTLKKKIKGFLK